MLYPIYAYYDKTVNKRIIAEVFIACSLLCTIYSVHAFNAFVYTYKFTFPTDNSRNQADGGVV